MNLPSPLHLPFYAVLSLVLFHLPARAEQPSEEILYRNIFSWSATSRNGGLANGQPNAVGWQQFTDAEGKSGETYSVNAGVGLPTDLENVNSSANPRGGTENGFFYPGVKPHSVILSVLAPDEQGAVGPIDPAQYSALAFRWYGSVQREGVSQRLAIQVDNDKWFVSSQPFSRVIGWKPFHENAGRNVVEFSPAAANWRELIFSPDSELKMSDETLTADLPAGQITNFGIFSENLTDGERLTSSFDTFEVAGTKKK